MPLNRSGCQWICLSAGILLALGCGAGGPKGSGTASDSGGTHDTVPNTFPENLKIRTDHPRLYLDASRMLKMCSRTADISEFLAYVTTNNSSTYMPKALRDVANDRIALKQWIRNRWNLVPNPVNDINSFGYLNKTYLDGGSLTYGLANYLAQNLNTSEALQARTLCRNVLEAFSEVLLEQDFTVALSTDEPPCYTLFALGVVYDWGWQTLDATLKSRIRARCLELLDYLNNNISPGQTSAWRYLTNANFSGGHTRYANTAALTALLALRHDVEADSVSAKANSLRHLAQVVNNWRNGYNPTQAWMGEGGGYGMGWAYGPSYTEIRPCLFWDSATTEERWMSQHYLDRWAFMLYGSRNTNTYLAANAGGYDPFPWSGDVWATNYSVEFQGPLLLAGANFGNSPSPYAAWVYQTFTQNQARYAWDLVMRNAGTTPQSPASLPLSRHFPHSGFVLMRDSWDLDNATFMEFKSSSYFSTNHHHRDQNAYTLFYRGPLAIDSGGYEAMGAYGSNHWRNYYIRSIAHNTMLVYNPNEVFRVYGTRASNDGGQRMKGVDNPTLAQIQAGGSNALEGILAFETRPEFTYALGDATSAYDPAKLNLFKRSVIFLPGHAGSHPGILIYDRVESAKAEYKKTSLLHAINEPSVNGKKALIQIDDGMTTQPNGSGQPRTPLKGGLVQETLLPVDAVLTKVGGSGFEFFVSDDGTGTIPPVAHNYIEGKVASSTRALREAGQWRIEVSPGAARTVDSFLQVLTVNDGDGTAITAQALASTARMDGGILNGPNGGPQTCILIQHMAGDLDESFSLTGTLPFTRLIAVGVAPGGRFSITKNASGLAIKTDAQGLYTASNQGVFYVPSL